MCFSNDPAPVFQISHFVGEYAEVFLGTQVRTESSLFPSLVRSLVSTSAPHAPVTRRRRPAAAEPHTIPACGWVDRLPATNENDLGKAAFAPASILARRK